jgi:hypothetical protein
MPPIRSPKCRNLIQQEVRLLLAIKAIKNAEKIPVRDAARQFDVPLSTLPTRSGTDICLDTRPTLPSPRSMMIRLLSGFWTFIVSEGLPGSVPGKKWPIYYSWVSHQALLHSRHLRSTKIGQNYMPTPTSCRQQ